MAGANPLGIIQGLLDVENTIGDFIKGDVGGDSAIANHFRDQYRARCEEFSNAPGWLQGFVGLGAGGAISRICKPYLDDNQWDSPAVDVPFAGGQCLCTEYRVEIKTTYVDQAATGSPPVVATAVRRCRGPVFSVVPTLRAPVTGAVYDWTITANRVGGPVSVAVCQPEGTVDSGSGTVGNGYAEGTTPTVEIDVSPVSGPDDCGDPEPVPVPGPNPAPLPDPIRLPGDEPRPNPRNPDGLPDIPVDPFPDPIFGPGFPALPDGFGFGGGRSGGGGAGRGFDPIENNDETGGQDEDFDDPPEGEVWVGAYLELTQVPGNITTVPGTGPENGAYFRIVGNFSIYSDSESSRLYSDSVQVRNQWTKFIGNPQGLPVSGARVSVLPGVRYRVIPVSAPADPDRNGEE